METMEQRRKRPRRSFSDEYKAEVVELCRTSGRSISEVSHDLGLTVSACAGGSLRPTSTVAGGPG